MLVSAPYSQASDGLLSKEKAMKERIVSLYSIFTPGVVQGFKGVSPYVKYVKSGLEKSKELAKRGYGYSLSGINYSYEKGKNGWYHVTIAKERAVPSLTVAKDYTGSVANLPTILPIVAQAQWLSYLGTLTASATTEFEELNAAGMCLEQNYIGSITGFSTALPVLAQKELLNYLGRLTTSPATRFDKALDIRYLQSNLGGGNHRLFDGGHTLRGGWSNIADMCAKTGCSTREQVNGYFGALWKDSITPKGLPFMTMEKQTYDSLAYKLKNYGISKNWTYDALSYDALEILGAGIAAATVVYFLRTEQVEELSEALGAMGVVSVVSANPLLALVMISSVAYAIATGTDLNAKAATEGVVKSSIVSGALVLLPGAFLLQVTAAVAIAVLLEKNMKDENYAFAKDYTMEKINELETWIRDIQKETTRGAVCTVPRSCRKYKPAETGYNFRAVFSRFS